MKIEYIDLGTMAYQTAWDTQLQYHQEVLDGKWPDGVVLLVEHPPVITLGRRPEAAAHVFHDATWLAQRGVELITTDRGGDVTFHGPGQLVAYPIIPLQRYGLNVHRYMRVLEDSVIQTLGMFALTGIREAGATGVWVQRPDKSLAKVCAMGVKIKRWISLHGLALNVTTDLSYFDLINPCGLARPVTSMQQLLPQNTPTFPEVKRAFRSAFTLSLYAIRSKVAVRDAGNEHAIPK